MRGQQRTDGAVQLGVHQDDVLAVLDGPHDHVAAELDRARHLDDASTRCASVTAR